MFFGIRAQCFLWKSTQATPIWTRVVLPFCALSTGGVLWGGSWDACSSHGTRQTTGPWLRRRQLVVGFQACRFQDILNSQSGSQCNFRWGPTSTSIFTLEPCVGHGMILCMPLPTCCSSSVGQHRLRSLKIRPVTRWSKRVSAWTCQKWAHN